LSPDFHWTASNQPLTRNLRRGDYRPAREDRLSFPVEKSLRKVPPLLPPAGAEGRVEFHLFRPPLGLELHLVSRLVFGQGTLEVVDVLDFCIAELDENVPRLEPGFFRGSPRHNELEENPFDLGVVVRHRAE